MTGDSTAASAADSDDELMLRFQRDRDRRAFEQLFRRQKDGLLRFLLRLVRNRAAANDASQQAWLKVIEVARRGGYLSRPDVAFRTWLFTVARNYAIDEYQRKFAAVHTVALEDDTYGRCAEHRDRVELDAYDPAESASRAQIATRLNAALLRLPFEQQQVIALWAADVEPASIAVMLRAPRQTVFSRKKYAIAKLRSALRDLAPMRWDA
jgi:RNA polymerase sigma factor (sigma-70 family)